MAKDEIGKGVTPEIDILVYEGIDQYGCKFYCKVDAWKLDPNGNLRRAWVMHPDFGLEEMTTDMGRIGAMKPIRCVTQDAVDGLIAKAVKEAIEAATVGLKAEIVELQTLVGEHSDVLARARAKVSAKVSATPAPLV